MLALTKDKPDDQPEGTPLDKRDTEEMPTVDDKLEGEKGISDGDDFPTLELPVRSEGVAEPDLRPLDRRRTLDMPVQQDPSEAQEAAEPAPKQVAPEPDPEEEPPNVSPPKKEARPLDKRRTLHLPVIGEELWLPSDGEEVEIIKPVSSDVDDPEDQ